MSHRTVVTRAATVAALAALGIGAPALAATPTSTSLKDPHEDAVTSTGETGAAKLDIYKITGAKAGDNLRLTITVHTLPANIKDADATGNHLVMGVATSNAGSGFEPTPGGKVRYAGGGDVCKGSATTYNFDTDTVKMVLPLKCVGGGATDQVISGFTFRDDVQVDHTDFSSEFSTK